MKNDGKSNMDVRDFQLLDGQRIYVKNRFEFYLESIGIYTSRQIVIRGIEYILKKLNILQDYISQNSQNEIQYMNYEKIVILLLFFSLNFKF